MTRFLKALDFAAKAHANQRRKYTEEPYINHCIAVARLVAYVPHTEDMLCAAVLHDVMEDCEVEYVTLYMIFGETIATYVNYLTDLSRPEDGNKARRKKIDRDWIAQSPPEAKTIKLADLIDNTSTVVQYDPEFAKVYMEEKRLLLDVLKEGDHTLWHQANDIVTNYFNPTA